MQTNVRVLCRFRPYNDVEKNSDLISTYSASVELVNENQVKANYSAESSKEATSFNFDYVFWTNAEQAHIFEIAAKPSVEDALKGYNATIFAYGQTGSGKSFTMFGTDSNPGIIPRSCRFLFESIRADSTQTEYSLKCSFIEIYKENIRDLLKPQNTSLKVRETPTRGVWIDGLSEHFVNCEDDILYLLQLGEQVRTVSSTKMNAYSSRSHSLFVLTIQQKSIDGSSKEGKLNFADLAGSEKIAKTGATGETLEEAKKINQSLSALGNCINALSKAKQTHVPYRDSKLTHALKESLGGNCKTTLLITCSPHPYNFEETVSTLQFGQRAKTIKNQVSVNKQRSVQELNSIINKLTSELDKKNSYIKQLEETILSLNSNFNFNNLNGGKDRKLIEEVVKPKISVEIELETLKESNSLKIQELQEEIQIEENRKERDNLKEQLDETSLQNEKLKMQLEEQSTLLNIERDKYFYKISQLQLEIKDIESKYNNLQLQNSALEKEIVSFKKFYENEQQKLREQIKDLKTLLQTSESKVQEKEKQINEFIDAARLRRNSVDKLEKENFDLNEKLKEVEEEKVIVEEMYLKLNEQLTSKEAENDILSQSLQKVKMQLGTLESLIQKLKLENEQINLSKAELLETDSKFQTLELTLQHANQVIKEMKKENETLKSKINSLEHENENCLSELQNQKAQLQTAQEKYNQLRIVLNSKETTETITEEKLKQKEARIQLQDSQIEFLSSKNSVLLEELDVASQLNQGLQKRANDLLKIYEESSKLSFYTRTARSLPKSSAIKTTLRSYLPGIVTIQPTTSVQTSGVNSENTWQEDVDTID